MKKERKKSGLPTDARVENLKFEGNLEATYKYLSILEDQIHKGAGIPDVLFQTDRAVSHTSAIAMKMLYQPILEKTERKSQSFSSAFRRTNKLIFTAFTLTQVDYASLATNPSDNLWDDIYPVFPDPLPYDEMGQIDADQKKFNLGVVSIATLIRKYNPAGDFARTSVELLADKMALLLYEREKAIALTGGSPNPVVVTLSSIGLDEAVSKLASEIASSVPAKITPPLVPAQPTT